jgi:hypothetical protein
MVEQQPCKLTVEGSIPFTSILFRSLGVSHSGNCKGL